MTLRTRIDDAALLSRALALMVAEKIETGIVFNPMSASLPRHRQLAARFRRAGLRDAYEDDRASMLRFDPPTHTRLRALVSKVFAPRAIERVQPRIKAILEELLDSRPARGALELVTELAAPLPVRVIAELLGIPGEDRNIGAASLADRHASVRASAELDRGTRRRRILAEPPWVRFPPPPPFRVARYAPAGQTGAGPGARPWR